MSSQLHFEMVVQIGDSSMRDVNYCAFVRSPMVNNASYCIIEVFMSQILARQLRSDVARQLYPDVSLTIYVDDEAEKGKMQQLFGKTFICLNMKTDKNIQFMEDRVHTTMVLVNKVLHYLSNHNTFNKIFLNKTAYQVLTEYEGFINSKFGCDGYNFQHMAGDINTHIYRQILTRAPNDLSVADYLIYNYKVTHSPCYYFFDLFYIARQDSNVNEVMVWFISLDGPPPTKINVGEYFDKQLTVNHIGSRPFSDIPQNFIGKKGTRYILKEPDIRAEYEKKPKITNVTKIKKPPKSMFELVEGRIVKVTNQSTFVGGDVGSSSVNTIYCPDNVGNGRKRFNNGVSTYQSLLQVEIYEMSNCLPDFPRFDEVYNLEDHNETQYNHTPISIINIFHRKNFKEQYLYHLAKTAMIRYKV